ncbi:uncharacterized protein LOC111447106 [Cucurbita moschata]|uniref:Uncharacterized protein LOC111447106 n=1 Tax=Cucurbita moschata TaxID=3662 RepID=A0A6J1FNP1_CUCMO|nr:uncharacterized protein LOC111447106 [Cucurbita moschata]
MASSSDNQQSKSKSKSTDSQPLPPPSAAHNPAPIYPPPTMGYPPAPHPGYPPAPGAYPPYNGYAYAQAPPAAYYHNSPQNYAVEPFHASFIRGIVTALIILVVLMMLTSIITWIILRPEIPTFRVDTLGVTNFNISKSNYSGNWNATLVVQNPNKKLNLTFKRIQGFVGYKDNTLAMSFADPFFLAVERTNLMRVRWTSSSPDDPGNWEETEEKLGKEKATRKVSFNLRFFVWTTFQSGSWWTRHVILRVFCDDLKIDFGTPNSVNGSFSAHGHHMHCAVLM